MEEVAKKTATKKKPAKVYGVAEMAKHMKLKEATVRLNLRKARVKKNGRAYAWKSESEMKAAAKRMSL